MDVGKVNQLIALLTTWYPKTGASLATPPVVRNVMLKVLLPTAVTNVS